jgi:peptide deformylase
VEILNILTYPDHNLRVKCQPVKEITEDILRLAQEMAETMYAAPGVGLAASQVGVPVQLAVVDVGWREREDRTPFILINPVLIHAEGEISGEEGCLSVPECTAEIKRSARVVVRALDREGKPVEITGQGLMAVALQHEIDHLNGILFFDHLNPDKREVIKKKLKARLK